jgi:glycosyltransferase involved in cell wall biosynthesis
MLDHITPVLLTFNEEPNIARTLAHLAWAKDIVVVDSGSTDGTLPTLANFPNVRVFDRRFDSHANQWRFATEETQIITNWILRLDADYQVTDALIMELAGLDPNAPVNGYSISFDYAVYSRKLRSALYPANTILLRRGQFSIRDKGHTETWHVDGPVETLSARIIHDDWKPVAQWLIAQGRYQNLQLEMLHTGERSVSGWLRMRPPLMPIILFLYCLFGKGMILSGRAGMFYALQRLVVESILALLVLEEKLRQRTH